MEQLDVGQAEGSTFGTGSRVLAWSKKKEKSKGDHVSDGDVEGVGSCQRDGQDVT
jgi:hypothetical protein